MPHHHNSNQVAVPTRRTMINCAHNRDYHRQSSRCPRGHRQMCCLVTDELPGPARVCPRLLVQASSIGPVLVRRYRLDVDRSVCIPLNHTPKTACSLGRGLRLTIAEPAAATPSARRISGRLRRVLICQSAGRACTHAYTRTRNCCPGVTPVGTTTQTVWPDGVCTYTWLPACRVRASQPTAVTLNQPSRSATVTRSRQWLHPAPPTPTPTTIESSSSSSRACGGDRHAHPRR
jgi:hypothetical protein